MLIRGEIKMSGSELRSQRLLVFDTVHRRATQMRNSRDRRSEFENFFPSLSFVKWAHRSFSLISIYSGRRTKQILRRPSLPVKLSSTVIILAKFWLSGILTVDFCQHQLSHFLSKVDHSSVLQFKTHYDP